MNKKATRPIVLVLVFLVALITFGILSNKENKDVTTTMEEATLPVMQFVYNDTVMNELHGYTKEMDMLSMRDGLMPIGESRQLNLEIQTYGRTIDNLSYKIRSMDGERFLVEEESAKFKSGQDKAECQINLPSLFEDNVEYNMEIALTMGDETIYYYTRIVREAECYVDETLAFALQFHDYTFRDDAASFIPTYMDPATGDATTLNYVDLSCTLGQITWADFEGVKLAEPVASFKEINNSYNVITLNYVMTNVNENKEVEYYNVEEYYRLRQAEERIYLLNFEREMTQIFRSDNDFLLGTSGLQLGIRNKDVEYMANDSGDCISFVQEGDLWCYDRVNNTLAQVFSFRNAEGINPRENWDHHDIKIISVDEAGSISFVVYGYMNRGVHEGRVGVGVYYYDAIAQTVEEEVFVETDKSYEVIKAELGELMYVNEQKQFFFMLNDNVYKIDLTTFEMATIIEEMTDDSYAVSASGRYFAWINPNEVDASTSIVLEDFKMGITHNINAGKNVYLRPIAFIGEDFVYGVAQAGDVKEDAVGNFVFPISKIEILNTSEDKLDVIKEYQPVSGSKITELQEDANNIYMVISTETNGRYIQTGTDTIMNRETEPTNEVMVSTTRTDVKQTQVCITMKETSGDKYVEILTPKHVLLEESRMVALDVENTDYYYVYVKGDVLLATKDASEAIRLANANYGVVVDSNVNYIFKRARSTMQTPLANLSSSEEDAGASSVVKCVSAILKKEGATIAVNDLLEAGQTPIEIVNNTLKDATVLELHNCSMDDLLYFVDQATPVFAKTSANTAVLITGYSSNYVYYYDPISGQTKSIDYAGIEEMFYDGGNYFIAYVK